MRKLLVPITAAAMLASVSLAIGQGADGGYVVPGPLGKPSEAYAIGSIKSVDATKSTITLDDGNTYTLPTSVKPTDLKVGQMVNVTYTTSAGKRMASGIAPVQ